MHEDERDALTPEEASALRALAAATGSVPPDGLEEKTLTRLKERGLIPARGRRRRIRLLAIAAGIALFATGLFVGQRRAATPDAASAQPRYVLLLYDAPDESTLTAAQMESRVDEYRNWAHEVARQGGDIHGEKLEDESRLLGADGSVAGARARVLGGYFVITATDYGAALALARTCPHLKHGGAIEVRPIAKT